MGHQSPDTHAYLLCNVVCRPWAVVSTVSGFRTQREALQFEYAWKHTAPRSVRGLKGRILKLGKLLSATLGSTLPATLGSTLH